MYLVNEDCKDMISVENHAPSAENIMVVIPETEYKILLEQSNFLTCLQAAGVDGWEGYEYACELSKE